MAQCIRVGLIFASFTDVPSLVRVNFKYLNWSTSLRTFPFIHVCWYMSSVWCFRRGLCFCHNWFPFRILPLFYPVFRSSSSLPPRRWSISSVNCRLHGNRPPMEICMENKTFPDSLVHWTKWTTLSAILFCFSVSIIQVFDVKKAYQEPVNISNLVISLSQRRSEWISFN